MAFGNASSNSYVFVGGLPSWYGGDVAGLENIVLPTVLLEPRFRGAIRNLAYKDARIPENTALNIPYSTSVKNRLPLQDLIAYKVSKLWFHREVYIQFISLVHISNLPNYKCLLTMSTLRFTVVVVSFWYSRGNWGKCQCQLSQGFQNTWLIWYLDSEFNTVAGYLVIEDIIFLFPHGTS